MLDHVGGRFLRRLLDLLGLLGGGLFELLRLGFLDLDQPLFERFGLHRDVFGCHPALTAGMRVHDEFGEEEETYVVVGAFLADLERLVDDVDDAQQVDEEERQETQGDKRFQLPTHVGEHQHDQDDQHRLVIIAFADGRNASR